MMNKTEIKEGGIRTPEEICSTVTATNCSKNSDAQPWISKSGSIRRLTEIECERLQGFPDNHTAFGNYDGVIKKIPKTQRYKMMGNAVMVDCVEAVALRLELYDEQ